MATPSSEWESTKRDLDAYLDALPDPTDEDLRAIEADPVQILTDDEFYEWLEALLEEE